MTDHAEALAKALEPFAKAARRLPEQTPDTRFADRATALIRFGHLRAARSALAAYRSRPAAEVVVKPLEWANPGIGIHYADSVVGTYKIAANGVWWLGSGSARQEASPEAAKAAAQADYEARIRSALTTPALAGTEPAGEVVEVPVEPTEAEIEAGCRAMHEAQAGGDADAPLHSPYQKSWDEPDTVRWKQWDETVREVRAAMLAAALRDQSEA